MANTPSILTEIITGDAYKKAIDMGADNVIEALKASGLRGRGGAGFPTGLKWEFTKNAAGSEKYIICNADEGEVGTFKDRKLLIEYAEKLIEGMAIAGAVAGAKKGIIYLRWEYSDLKAALEQKIKDTTALFTNIVIEVRMGAGAYVCGEETALIESAEGKRGEVRNKPPYPGTAGYLGAPTIINNVETFCCVVHILVEGADTFASVGTQKSKGPKLFSISGDVEKPGVYEFPMGTKLSEILKAAGAKDTKAVMVGGASGTVVAEDGFDRVLAFEDLPPGGAIIVMNKTRNMGAVLENVLDFFAEESCGQCVPCREGNYRLLKFVKKIKTDGTVTSIDLKRYKELANTMKLASKCGLGQSSPNPFLSILQNFQDEIVKVEEVQSNIPNVCKY
ncbi:MAG: NADH-ubiquinone oxidoreductase-F iron-sulfur binding region domain-containing protein [Candidatus Margulisiibacteriota bacterium]